MMKLNRRVAPEYDRDHVVGTVRWCRTHGLELGGFAYDDPLVNQNGIHLQLLVPTGTSDEACEAALKAGYRERDVVSHSVKFCPPEWFE